MREIARRAKVSTATVSRTINGVPSVTPHLAKRIWKIVEEVGYYPDTQARGLVSGRSRTFGLIVSEITNPFFPEIVQVLENIAVQHNYEILVSSTVHDPERMKHSVRRMIERRVEGVAVMTFGMEEALLDDFKFRNIPLVFVDVGPGMSRVSNIRVDYLNGLRHAVQHLAALRHTKIAFVSGPLALRSAVARREAFLHSMEEIQLSVSPEFLIEGNHTMEGGVAAMEQLLQLPERPTAVVCSNDMTAIGVMRKSHEYGLKVPDDISIVGFDDIRLSEFIIPALTTVQMSQAELARLAFQALYKEVQRKTPAPRGTEYVLVTKLVQRDSTGIAPDAKGTGRNGHKTALL
ncbi:MAG TPA: LacI family DNA-binding transcriptional regulator [Candidatus Saccharimonadales bacterium]|jgi:LacI family transcriptional regulator|nr:LacI family DNA-binding transcriptional regulator [Candidatus Saccharimonadales bacterium]